MSTTKVPWGKYAVGFAFFQAAVICAMECFVIYKVMMFIQQSFDKVGSVPFIMIYFGLFLFAMVFQAGVTWDAANHKNTMQSIAVLIFNWATVAYAAVQIIQIKRLSYCGELFISGELWHADGKDMNTKKYCQTLPLYDVAKYNDAVKNLDAARPVEIAILVTLLVFVVIGTALTFKVYQEYGWQIFQQQGASIKRKHVVRRYHLFILLLKMNIFFSAGIVAQMACAYYYSVKGGNTTTTVNAAGNGNPFDKSAIREHPFLFAVLPAGIVLVVAAISYYLLGWHAVRRANRPLMISFFIVMLCQIAAIVTCIYIVNSDDNFKISQIWLTLFASIQLLLNIATTSIAAMVYRDFPHLRDVVHRAEQAAHSEYGMAPPAPRIELD